MNGAYHDAWYAQDQGSRLQELDQCLSSRFGGDEELSINPFRLDDFDLVEKSQPLETDDINDSTSITSLNSGSKIRSVDLKGSTLDPKAWPYNYKICISVLLNAFPLVVAIGTSILSPAGPVLVKEFHSKSEITVLTTSLFMLGFACGPLVWGPLSEKVGRKYPLLVGLALFALFCIPIALAKNLATILVCRFLSGAFGSSSMAVTGGALTDLWSSPVSRGIAMDCFVSMGFIGPVLGPIAGTFLVQSSLGWRWTMWISAIVSAVLCLFALAFLPETYAPIPIPNEIDEKRVGRPKATIGHTLAHIKSGSLQFLRNYLSRPLALLATEPILVLVTIYMSFCYGLLFLFIQGYPIAFHEVRGWTPRLSSLTFIGLLVGVGCGMFGLIIHALTVLAKKIAVTHGKIVPEERLPPMILGAIVLPLGLFCFAWTSSPHITWIPQVLAGIPVGAAMFAILIQGIKYIVDVYLRYANSAISANTIVRSFFAAGFPLFSTGMYHNLGVTWATSTLAFLAIAFIPIPIVFYLYGHKIRNWSKTANQV